MLLIHFHHQLGKCVGSYVLNNRKSYARKLASTIKHAKVSGNRSHTVKERISDCVAPSLGYRDKNTAKVSGNRSHTVKERISDCVAPSLGYRDIQRDPIVMTSVKRKGHVSACTKIYHRLRSFCLFCVRGHINRLTDK